MAPPSGDADSTTTAGTAGNGQAAGGGETVRIGYFPLVHTATLVHADDAGYLDDAGITAELIQTQGGAAAIPSLISGEIDMLYSNITSAVLAAQRGLPVAIIAGNDIGGEDHGLFVMPGSSIESVQDIAGHSFAVNNLQNIGTVAISAQAEDAGVDPTDIELVEIPNPDMIPALQQGNVDVIWQVEPFQAMARGQDLQRIGSLFEGAAANLPVGVWITTQDFAASNPAVVEGLRMSLQRSMDELNGNRDLFMELVPEYTLVQRDVVEEIELPRFDTALDQGALQNSADLMHRYGLIDQPLDVSDLIIGA